MKTWIHTLMLLVLGGSLALPTAAQNQRGGMAGGSVEGVVVDATSNDPLASATVSIWRTADSTLVTGTITQDEGQFSLEGLRPGAYYLKVSFVGFISETFSDLALSPGETLDLGRVALAADTQLLDDVEVTAERPFMEVAIDRTVYNTRDQLVSIGGNASDVLDNIPSVEVDIDGNISLRGSQNVAVLINGRPTPMEGPTLTSFLQGLPSDAIERVEVIPNPSARYEPDGMSGILNIVLKQDRDLGLNGSTTLGIATNSTYNASGNVNYQTGPWNLSTGYSFRSNTRDFGGERYRENLYREQEGLPLTYLETEDIGERVGKSHNLNTGIDYRFDDVNTLSLSTRLNYRGNDSEDLTSFTELDEAKNQTARYNRFNVGEDTDFSTDVRLAFRHILDPSKHELTVEASYEKEWEDEFERYEETILLGDETLLDSEADRQTSDQSERQQEGEFQVDYLRPLGQDGKLEAGYKASLERLDNEIYEEYFDETQNAFVPTVDQNRRFTFDQQVHAAYGILGGQFGKFGLQGGVRLEQALTTFDLTESGDTSYDNNYFSIFPSAFVTYEVQEGRSFKLSYSKRINRPRVWSLNPIDDNDNPLFRRQGNPYLKPEYIHAFEAGYTQFTDRTSLSISPYFRRTVDVIRWREKVEDGVTIFTFENLDVSDSWGTEVIGTLNLNRWLRGYASINGYKIVTDGSSGDTDLSNNAFGYTSRINATVNVRDGLDVQMSFFYRSPIDLEGGGRMSARTMANIAIRQQFLNDRASLSLRVSDLFNTMNFSQWREDATFYQYSTRSFDSQNLYLSFTYNFGQQQRRNRDRDRDDVQGGGMEGGDVGGEMGY